MGESTDNNWLSSLFSAAKSKGSVVYEFVKKDLEEFGNAVKNEATNVVCSTGSALESTLGLNEPESTASSMKRSFSSFLGQMNYVLKQGPDDTDTEAILITEGNDNVPLSKLQKIMYDLQTNDKTFLEDIDPSLQQQFQCWLDIADDEFEEHRLNRHLRNSSLLDNQYKKFVPENVSHDNFWKRYLFKKALLEDELAREYDLRQKQELKQNQTTEEFKWEHEDFSTNVDLTEEEQIRLLQEYEEETKQKLKPKTEIVSDAKTTINKSERSIETVKNDQVKDTEDFGKVKTSMSDNKINNVESSTGLDLESKSSNSSSDGDWEKVSDVEK